MKELHKILTGIQDKIGGDEPCRVTVEIDQEGDLNFTAAWDDPDWCVKTMFTRAQVELARDPSCLVDLFVVLVRESDQYKGRQEGAG